LAAYWKKFCVPTEAEPDKRPPRSAFHSRGIGERYSRLPANYQFFWNPVSDTLTQLLKIGIALQAYTPIVSQFQLNVINLSFPAIKNQCSNFLDIQHGFFSSGKKGDFITVDFNPMILDQPQVTGALRCEYRLN
jgi:hypothetical protein